MGFPQAVGGYSISIHALLAESDDGSPHGGIDTVHISIHALLAESDQLVRGVAGRVVISIHALLAESDVMSDAWRGKQCIFLSTLSLRRATSERGYVRGA